MPENPSASTPVGNGDTICVPVPLFKALIELADIGLIEASAAMELGLAPNARASTLQVALELLEAHREKRP